jgi:hypothetical protein
MVYLLIRSPFTFYLSPLPARSRSPPTLTAFLFLSTLPRKVAINEHLPHSRPG